MAKKCFVTEEKVREIAKEIPTPFHIYDEKGIRENAAKVKKAFSWNKGFREYYAVKANCNTEKGLPQVVCSSPSGFIIAYCSA